MTLHIVTGPPAAGKSTFVREQKAADDAVIDFDLLAQALGSSSPHDSTGTVRQLALSARRAAIEEALAPGHSSDVWIIHTSPTAEQLDEYVAADAVMHEIDPGIDVVLAQAEQDGRPDGTADAIRAWYGVEKNMTKDRVKTAAADGFDDRTGVVIVALPAADDPIVAASSEDIAHITLIWLGDLSELTVTVDELKVDLEAWARQVDGPITEGVSGSAVLGAENAQVVLVDAGALAQLRNRIIDAGESDSSELETPIAVAHRAAEQFPTWIPHVTLGYPDSPPAAEYAGTEITFDRLALWVGDDRTEYAFGEPVADTTATPDLVARGLTPSDGLLKVAAFQVEVAEDAPDGEFTAVVAVFGNVDSQGDVVDKGAFADSLAAWAAKGDPIPVIFNHDWANPFAHIGSLLAENAEETDRGLEIRAHIDMDEPYAAKVYKLMKQRRLTQFSFTARAAEGGWSLESLDDGTVVSHLKKLDLIEVGPTLVGANSLTELVSIKSGLGKFVGKEGRVLAQKHVDTLKSIHSSLAEIIGAVEKASPPGPGNEDEASRTLGASSISKARLALSKMKGGSE
jgi:HK97 family phage prohead protease